MKPEDRKTNSPAKTSEDRSKKTREGALMRKILPGFLTLVVWLALSPGLAARPAGQDDLDALKKTAPKVYVDCASCDLDYIRTEITFVNYVRDRKEAHVHVLITTQSTGSGGREYTLAFLGQNEFKSDDDKVRFFTNKTDTQDEIRQGLVKGLKMGLMRYVAKTPIASRVSVSYRPEEKQAALKDRWNSWLFSVGGSGFFNGEKRFSMGMMSGNLSANRVTAESMIRLGLSAMGESTSFMFEDSEIESRSEAQSFSGLYVKSLSDHWSVGFYLNASTSTFDNIKFSLAPGPAVEFNLFPYSLATRRQLRFLYRLSFQTVRYRQETIYDKIKQNLWAESLSITLELKEKWGMVSTSLEGRHFFHDRSKYSLELEAELSLHLLKGLSFNINGSGSRIHNQLSLPKGEASLDEVLLRRRQLATTYHYYFSVGFSYTFGSIFTNVVNPRFGSGNGMSMNLSF